MIINLHSMIQLSRLFSNYLTHSFSLHILRRCVWTLSVVGIQLETNMKPLFQLLLLNLLDLLNI